MVMHFIYLCMYIRTYLKASEYISDGLGEDNQTFHRVSNGKSICFYMVRSLPMNY